ncbi:hypothetical protein L1785_12215 [Antribacter sp. KLBMP9083]|uniref:Uncharacterized protein n=1 Tax=Antribacter soli TaxID=2910976 RepID=A0AA41QEN3_9MICO|nr:hypothetical protein [Antribacter soli]MCF4121748.1 hypothetical protein [Antribacter soli]
MSRAEGLAVAWDFLAAARSGLGQVARLLTVHDLPAPADLAAELRERVSDLYDVVRKEADAAHRAENPGAYDEHGRWIGKGKS